MLQTIAKVGPVLDLFTEDHTEWGVSEAAEALGIPRSTAHSLLSSLAETGLLMVSSKGRYRLGWRIVELNAVMHAGNDIRSVAEPVLLDLNEQTGETTNLGVLDRGYVIYLDKLAARHQVGVTGVRIGAKLEAHCSAIGKVLLAYESAARVQAILASPTLRRFTDKTITDPQVLERELEMIRSQGVAYESGEAVADVACIAAPVKDAYGVVVAAVSITGPEFRVDAHRETLGRAVKGAAANITARLTIHKR